MEELKNAALMLLFASAMGLIYCFLLPSGKISQTAKSVLSVFMLLCALGPLFSFMNMELPELDTASVNEFADLDDEFVSVVKSAMLKEIDGVVKKYTEMPYNVELRINILEDRSIDIEQVRIIFDAGFMSSRELDEELAAALGITPEITAREEE